MKIKENIITIILTYNEEENISRAIKSAKKISNIVYVVDSFSDDQTISIAKRLNAKILKKKFKNHSEQFNWALSKIKPKNKWVLRLDADEYLENNLIAEIKEKLKSIDNDVNGITFRLKEKFLDQFIKYGGRRKLRILRLWKYGYGKIEDRLMDEGVYLSSGKIKNFSNFIVNDNSKTLQRYIDKHQIYATKEAVEIIKKKYDLTNRDLSSLENISTIRKIKIFIKENIFNKLSYPVACSIYFIYRYIILLGFLDGKKGFLYHFLQGFWYRVIVGAKVDEIDIALKKIKKKKKLKKKIFYLTKITI